MKEHVRAQWAGAILICGKCSKKLDGKPLAKALRREPGFGKGRKATLGVIETRCLGVCPRGAAVLVDTRTPGRWRIVPEGADVAALGAALRNVGNQDLPRSR